MILVCVLDDGSRDQGEWFRIRGTRAVIGRAEGDILIPHDEAMSSRHAELVRHMESGRWRWFLTDLKSTNGTYARISKSVLKHGQEILVGSSRFRFDAAPQGAADNGGATARDAPSPPTTYDWEAVEASEVMPSLVELRARGEGQRYLLDQDECWIGSDPQQAAIVLSNDPLASSRHARIFKDARGRWYIENSRSLNGTWLRIDRLPVDSAGQFQMGEQRFLVRVP
jgi:pSer/pThr/pTyr-binding forkhead associated (FHA) protein